MKKKLNKKFFIIIIIILGLVLFFVLFKYKPGKVTMNSKTTLKKQLEKADIQLMEYSTTTVVEKDEYYVACSGTVKTFIDIEKIDLDENPKNIIVNIPQIDYSASNIVVKDIIFRKYNADKENLLMDQLIGNCKETILHNARNNKLLYNSTKTNIEKFINSSFKIYKDKKKIKINYTGEGDGQNEK